MLSAVRGPEPASAGSQAAPSGFQCRQKAGDHGPLWREPCQLACACACRGRRFCADHAGLCAAFDRGSGYHSADEGRAQRAPQRGRGLSVIPGGGRLCPEPRLLAPASWAAAEAGAAGPETEPAGVWLGERFPRSPPSGREKAQQVGVGVRQRGGPGTLGGARSGLSGAEWACQPPPLEGRVVGTGRPPEPPTVLGQLGRLLPWRPRSRREAGVLPLHRPPSPTGALLASDPRARPAEPGPAGRPGLLLPGPAAAWPLEPAGLPGDGDPRLLAHPLRPLHPGSQ